MINDETKQKVNQDYFSDSYVKNKTEKTDTLSIDNGNNLEEELNKIMKEYSETHANNPVVTDIKDKISLIKKFLIVFRKHTQNNSNYLKFINMVAGHIDETYLDTQVIQYY